MPILVEYPQNLTLKSGETAWFACKTYDPHRTRVEWYYLNNINPRDIDSDDLVMYRKMVNYKTVRFSVYVKTLAVIVNIKVILDGF